MRVAFGRKKGCPLKERLLAPQPLHHHAPRPEDRERRTLRPVPVPRVSQRGRGLPLGRVRRRLRDFRGRRVRRGVVRGSGRAVGAPASKANGSRRHRGGDDAESPRSLVASSANPRGVDGGRGPPNPPRHRSALTFTCVVVSAFLCAIIIGFVVGRQTRRRRADAAAERAYLPVRKHEIEDAWESVDTSGVYQS